MRKALHSPGIEEGQDVSRRDLERKMSKKWEREGKRKERLATE